MVREQQAGQCDKEGCVGQSSLRSGQVTLEFGQIEEREPGLPRAGLRDCICQGPEAGHFRAESFVAGPQRGEGGRRRWPGGHAPEGTQLGTLALPRNHCIT